jgi:nicotinate-nucleotide pyrophosphorylase (carboxylating)
MPQAAPAHGVEPGISFEEFCLVQLACPPDTIRAKLGDFLHEDVGHGDVTLRAMGKVLGKPRTLGSASTPAPLALAKIVAKEDCTLAGVPLAAETLRIAHGTGERSPFRIIDQRQDGDRLNAGDAILVCQGSAAAMLMAERPALNLLARLSGVASHTAAVVARLQQCEKAKSRDGNSRTTPRLLETRKTTPGLKIFEKYATRTGGARNHRMGLDAGAMLKENHLRAGAAAGWDQAALTSHVLSELPLLAGLEVEVTNLEEFRIALRSNAAVIMLDNFDLNDAAQAVHERDAAGVQTLCEISGNLDRTPIEQIVATGVDLMSMGALIHQAKWTDISLVFERL